MEYSSTALRSCLKVAFSGKVSDCRGAKYFPVQLNLRDGEKNINC